jgi:hypothetical protein
VHTKKIAVVIVTIAAAEVSLFERQDFNQANVMAPIMMADKTATSVASSFANPSLTAIHIPWLIRHLENTTSLMDSIKL